MKKSIALLCIAFAGSGCITVKEANRRADIKARNVEQYTRTLDQQEQDADRLYNTARYCSSYIALSKKVPNNKLSGDDKDTVAECKVLIEDYKKQQESRR